VINKYQKTQLNIYNIELHDVIAYIAVIAIPDNWHCFLWRKQLLFSHSLC